MSKPAEITDAFLKHVFAQSEKATRELVEVAYQHGIQDERERCAKLAEKERKKWARPGGASCSSQQMQEYAKMAAASIRDAIKGRAHEVRTDE